MLQGGNITSGVGSVGAGSGGVGGSVPESCLTPDTLTESDPKVILSPLGVSSHQFTQPQSHDFPTPPSNDTSSYEEV